MDIALHSCMTYSSHQCSLLCFRCYASASGTSEHGKLDRILSLPLTVAAAAFLFSFSDALVHNFQMSIVHDCLEIGAGVALSIASHGPQVHVLRNWYLPAERLEYLPVVSAC